MTLGWSIKLAAQTIISQGCIYKSVIFGGGEWLTQTLARYFYLCSISPNVVISLLITFSTPIDISFFIFIYFIVNDVKLMKLPHHTNGVKVIWRSIGKNGRAKLITEKIHIFLYQTEIFIKGLIQYYYSWLSAPVDFSLRSYGGRCRRQATAVLGCTESCRQPSAIWDKLGIPTSFRLPHLPYAIYARRVWCIEKITPDARSQKASNQREKNWNSQT